MVALLLAATNLSQAQDANVVLLYPENGATGIIDPIDLSGARQSGCELFQINRARLNQRSE